jgi:hypothetical protein
MEAEGSFPCSQERPIFLTLIQMHPDYTFPPYFPTTHSNIIFPSTLVLPTNLFLSDSPTTILYALHVPNYTQEKCTHINVKG